MKNPQSSVRAYPDGRLLSALLTFSVVVVYYLKLFFLPFGLTPIYDDFPIYDSFSQGPVIGSLLLLSLITVLIVHGFVYRKAYAPYLAWFFLYLLPTSNIIPIWLIAAERFLYFPLMGLIPGLLLLIKHIFEKTRLGWQYPLQIICLIFLLFLSVVTVRRNIVWQEPQKLWQETLKSSQDNMSALINLGNVLFSQEKYSEALEVYLDALDKHPKYPENYLNVGCAYEMLGQIDEAEKYYVCTLLLDKGEVLAYVNLGLLYLKKEELKKAQDVFLKGLKVDPSHPKINYYLGIVYNNLGEAEKAAEAFKNAQGWRPE